MDDSYYKAFFQVFKSYLRKKTHYIRYKIEKVAVNLRI